MTDLVTTQRHGDVAVITIDNPPLNVFSPGVPEALASQVREADTDAEVRAIVVTGAGRHFVAGADITTFTLPAEERPDVRSAIGTVAAAATPLVAALRGTALGGGLELALACHWRVAAPGARLGLPEVKLGLLPGAGGTQRLPRLVGLEPALRMIPTGTAINAEDALAIGLVDQVAEGDLLEAAVGFARSVAGTDEALRRTDAMTVAVDGDAGQILEDAREQARRQAPGLVAPQRCIDAVAAAVELPFVDGLARERSLFDDLLASDQSKALRHVFFAERAAARVDDVADDTEALRVRRGAVVGAGTMGGGIAMTFANADIPVTVIEADRDSLDRGLARVADTYQAAVDKGRLDASDKQRRLEAISGAVDIAAVGDADVVVEAVYEDMDLKRDVFRRLDHAAGTHAVLATNTSTLDVNALAGETGRPGSVVGMHFFSPANVMKLLEVVRADATSDRTLLTAVALGKAMGKVPVVVGVCDGFVGNRMFGVYTHEASLLLEEGALPRQVDRVMTEFGFRMGPFAVSDLAGLDVGYRIRQRQRAEGTQRREAVADTLVERGRLGQKTGAGFYRYEQGSRRPIPDPEVEQMIVAGSDAMGVERREIGDQEIRDRLLGQLINEGARILEENVAQRSGDIDVIYVYGYGFPAHRGGPMFHAGLVGLGTVLATVERLHDQHGDRWSPAPLLRRLAERGLTFADA